jgi:glycosyltransferase involved in cell wall biosynthesis
MPRVLVFCNDLPYFPGKNGHDFFNLRYLAGRHEVVVVGPRYDFAPEEGVRNLESAVDEVIAWPRPVDSGALFIQGETPGALKDWVHRIPGWMRRWILRRLLEVDCAPSDAFERLAIQANCAPHLLEAFKGGPCKAIVLIQSNLAPCLDYLPGPGARIVYFHDIRTDFLASMQRISGKRVLRGEHTAVRRQEESVCRVADAVGFVSNLDLERATRLFQPTCATGVAPIPVDTEYFTPAPAGWQRCHDPVVLFTGHLTHPPNIDAIKYFLSEIWPLIIREQPDARFVAAGLLPSEELRELTTTVRNFELHANVPDIRPYFWDARVYVVPMRFGGGVRQKIFEAWSMELPVICTTMAAEGITVRDGGNCWLADTPSAFAARVVETLQSVKTPEVVRAAKEQVEATHSIPVAARKFSDLVESTISIKKAKPFRLLYDLRWMEIGRAGGAEQMTHELIAAISHLDHRNDYRVFCPRSTFHEWRFPSEFRVRPIYSDRREYKAESLKAGLVQQFAGGFGLHPVLTPAMRTLRALGRMDFDIVHSMVGYIHPDLEVFPQVLTALDLQHVHHPQFFPEAELRERDRLYRVAARRAHHIICISEYTRQDMHIQYGIPLEKMSAIWAIPSRHSSRLLPDGVCKDLLEGMGIAGPFVFFPAHGWAHKNHARLIEAFDGILGEIPKDMQLILSGRPFPEDHPAKMLIRDRGLEQRVSHLGYRSPIEIQALFQGCLVLAFPSLFEGFGMPVAEAILAGKPVACSNCTSLPEIAGDAALTFDPTNATEMGARILEIISDTARRDEMAAAALRRRSLFSPRLSAIKTLAVYQRVHEELYT